MIRYDITPVSKPRMTISDKWKKPRRPDVAKYYAFKDECKLKGINLKEHGTQITFYIPMAKSWSKKKKELHNGRMHQQTPDKDNLEKALLDAVFDQDCMVWDSRIVKRWSYTGAIVIKNIYLLPEIEILET